MIHWWVNASFTIHPNCCIHTRAVLSIGKGTLYSMSSKQKLNTHSLTEAKLVGINDAVPCAWLTMTIVLVASRHITSIFGIILLLMSFVMGEADIQYCPTGDMLANFFMKPLQGSLFCKFCNMLLNMTDDEMSCPASSEQECVGTQICEPIFGQRILRPWALHTCADVISSCTSKSAPTQMDDLSI